MQALILAGGKGTRLRPLTIYTPKPIVPVVNRPFLGYQLDVLSRASIRDITLSLNYQPSKIEHLLGDGGDFDVNLRYVTEPMPMGTAGAYKFAGERLRETTVVFNGDILTDLDIAKVIKFHRDKKADATIVLTPVENPSAYGLVETDEENRVLRFLEKPKPEEIEALSTKNINAGIYVLEPEVADLIPKGENYSFEYNLFPDLLKKEKAFYAFVMDKSYWRDIGTPESYLAAHHDFLSSKIDIFELERNNDADVATTAFISESSVIGEGCVVKPNATIVNSVLGPGVHVEERAFIENSVIWSHAHIAASARVSDSVIARSCFIGSNAVVGPGSVLGDKTSLTDYSKV